MQFNEKAVGYLRAWFDWAWSAVGAREVGAFDALWACYAEPHRAYHNDEHLAECLGWFERVRELAERPAEVALGLFFHDLVYDPLRHDNERASAARFESLASSAGLAPAASARVKQLIVSTAEHDCARGDGALLGDIDLAILGAAPARFARYEVDIRREYDFVEEAIYRRARAQVLRGLLERMAIYRTDHFFSLLEAQARENLRYALLQLEQGEAAVVRS